MTTSKITCLFLVFPQLETMVYAGVSEQTDLHHSILEENVLQFEIALN